LLLAGRTEFLEKYTLAAAELVRRGFSVASLDWRGQGLSQRLIQPHVKGHVGHFTHFHRDLEALTAHPLVAQSAEPRLLVANSMGAAIGLGALYRRRVSARAVVLLAPMLGIVMSRWMRLLSRVTLPLAKRTGRTGYWPPLRHASRPYIFSGFPGNQLTADREMFDWLVTTIRTHSELQLAMPTLGWLAEAQAEMAWLSRQGVLDCPALCLLGGREEVVVPDAVRMGATRIGARLETIADARHDILMERPQSRTRAWDEIDNFLAETGL
jgi:lysophospholipase